MLDRLRCILPMWPLRVPEAVVELGAQVLHDPGVLGHRLVLPAQANVSAASAMSVVGVAISTCLDMAYSMSRRSCSQAAVESGSPG